MHSTRFLSRLGVICGGALLACFATAATRFDVSSLDSDYVPVGRIWGQTSLHDSVVDVLIDSMLVAVPGPAIPGAPPSVGQLTVSALTATAGAPRWRALTIGSSIPIVDTLRFGQSVVVRNLRLRVPQPREVPLDQAFLVFEFRGHALQRPELGESVRTYACGADFLRHRPDAARARALLLAQSYTRTC